MMKANNSEYQDTLKHQYNWFFAENRKKAIGLLRAHSILRIILASMAFVLSVSLLLLPIYKVSFENGWTDIFSASILTRAIWGVLFVLHPFSVSSFSIIDVLTPAFGVTAVVWSVIEFVQAIKHLVKCKEYAAADFSVITEGLIARSGGFSWMSFIIIGMTVIMGAQGCNWIILILCFIALMQLTIYWILAEMIFRRCLRCMICKAYERKYGHVFSSREVSEPVDEGLVE